MSLRISDRVQQIGPTLDMHGQFRTHVLLDQGHQLVSVDQPAAKLIRQVAEQPTSSDMHDQALVAALIQSGILSSDRSSVDAGDQTGPSSPFGQTPTAQPTSVGRWHVFDPERLPGMKRRSPTKRTWMWLFPLLAGLAMVVSLGMSAPTLQRRTEQLLQMPQGWPVVIVLVVLGVLVHEIAHAWALIRGGGRCRSIGISLNVVPGMYADVKSVLILPDRAVRASVYLAGLSASAAWTALMLQIAEGLAVSTGSLAWASMFSVAGWLTCVLLIANAIPWPGSDMHRALTHLRIPLVEDAPRHSPRIDNGDAIVSIPLTKKKA